MVSWVCLQFVIVVFPDHTHFLFIIVISVIARLGFKDRIWFGLCNFLVTFHVIFVQSSTSMVCKLTSCDVDSKTGIVSSCVLAGIYCAVPW